MNHRRILACLSALLLLTAVGCGSDDSGGSNGAAGTGGAGGSGGASGSGGQAGAGTGGTGGSSATGGSGGSAGMAGTGGSAGSAGAAGEAGTGGSAGGPSGNVISLNVTDIGTQDPLEGVDVCIHVIPPTGCVTTDVDGVAAVEVPQGQDVVLEYSMASMRKHLIALRGDYVATNPKIFTLAASEFIASYVFQSIGVQDDPAKGHILGVIASGAGATVALEPMSGTGPVYSDTSFIPDLNLTETSASGGYAFANVNPGKVTVTITQTGLTCVPEMGMLGATPNSIKIPVEAGAFTIGTAVDCN